MRRLLVLVLALAMVLASCGGSGGSNMACQTFIGLDSGAQSQEVAASSGDLDLSANEAEDMGLRGLAVSACEGDSSATVGTVVEQLISGLSD